MHDSSNVRSVPSAARCAMESLEKRALLAADAALEAAGFQAIQWNGQTTYAVPGQWIVRLDGVSGAPGKQLGAADGLLNAAGLATRFKASKHLGDNGLFLVTSKQAEKFADVKGALAKIKGLRFVEPDFAVYADLTPNDPSYSSLWGMHNTGQTGGTTDADIDAPEAWDIATGAGSNVVIGVIDSGVNYNHPDLAPNRWINPGEIAGNAIDDDGNGYVDDVYGWDFINNDNNPLDDNGHGTHVAGTIAAVGNNSVGVVGVSWGAKIMALKFLGANGSGSTSGAISALNYATKMKTSYGINLKATNNSWGGGGFSSSLQTAIQNNANAGILFVAAAGNSGSNNDTTASYPSNYPIDNVIAVAATDHRDLLASFSSYGATTVDLGAPGVSIYSTYGSGYSSLSGTSMATPHVAGAIALAAEYAPAATYLQLRSAILNGVDAIASLAGKTVTGGRLNAARTLSLLAPSPIPAPSAPALNSATAVSSSRIDLSWSNVSDESGYYVYRSSGGSAFTLVADLGADVTSYSNVGLNPSTTYTYFVRAYNGGGESGDSNQRSATTLAGTSAPAAPSNLALTALSRSQIRLNWADNSGNETGFYVERSTNGSSWSQIASVGANTTTYTATGLKRNRLYYFRVRAYNSVGNSAYSNVASTKTLASGSATSSLFAAPSLFSTAPIAGDSSVGALAELEALISR